jgi:hypothetical protein
MQELNYAVPVLGKRRWLRTLLIVLGVMGMIGALAIAAVGLLISQIVSGPRIDLLDFDSTKWQAASNHDRSHDSVRLRMADSFLSDRQPVGKTRDQLVALLGEPDDTEYFRNYDMVYYLGPERGPFGIDSEWLVIKLTDGVAAEARLVAD